MLKYELLKNHAGVAIVGDYETLRDLHRIIHDVNEGSPIIKDKEGIFIGLAYDLRKAYEGQRRKLNPPEHYPEIGPRFGVEILWPVLLVQSRILRVSMSFMETNKGTQANAYALEHLIEEALHNDFGADHGGELVERWKRIDPAHPFPEKNLLSRGAIFCSWTKAKRKKYMSSLVASLDPMYPIIHRGLLIRGEKDLIAPEEFEKWNNVEWPDPKW